ALVLYPSLQDLDLSFPDFWEHFASVYGKCVAATTTSKRELKKDLCAKEFAALKTCFTNAVSKTIKVNPSQLSRNVW
uniref:Uncharacterized protein n=1 Tax=Gouania willdenowi TaxID=441366 RepID=A0A8C5EPP7_GOUWI